MIKIFEDAKRKLKKSLTPKKERRTPVLSSEIARLSQGENCFDSVISEIEKKDKVTNKSTIEKLQKNHKKHMSRFLSDEEFDKIFNEGRKISNKNKEIKENEEA